MEPKSGSIDYSSSGYRISSPNEYLPSTTPSYASSDRVGCSYNIGNGTSIGGFVSHDSSKVGGSGYGAGFTLGFKF